MRSALARKSRPGARVARDRSYPAPVKGWVSRKSLADMRPDEAVALVNWYPRSSYVEVRGGCSTHATGMTGNGKTLAVYNALGGTSKMFCATASGVYDVSSAGAVGASVASRTDGKHQWVMFGDGTSNWLIMVNGVDKPLYYDGSTWTAVDGSSSPALTGLTTTNIIGVNAFKGRLFFIQKSSMSYWYLTAGAAGGALTEIDLSAEAKMGGYLVAMASWTIDAGDGIDDRAVFITSEGEVIIYQGTDPSDATRWAKVGTYFLGRPLGRRCFVQFGGNLVILTQNGVLPLDAVLRSNTGTGKDAVSFDIEQSFNEVARTYGSVFGWRAIVYPAQSALIVNVPLAEDGVHEQYVMNTTSKAWCRFTQWDAEDFAVFNGELYYADGTIVCKAWSGTSDRGDNIEAYAKTAFSYFGLPGVSKHFKLFRPVLAVNGSLSFLADIDVDFKDDDITGTATYAVFSGAVWDAAVWDAALWGSGTQVIKEWTTPGEWPGSSAAGKLKITTNSLTIRWMASEWVYEVGYGL